MSPIWVLNHAKRKVLNFKIPAERSAKSAQSAGDYSSPEPKIETSCLTKPVITAIQAKKAT